MLTGSRNPGFSLCALRVLRVSTALSKINSNRAENPPAHAANAKIVPLVRNNRGGDSGPGWAKLLPTPISRIARKSGGGNTTAPGGSPSRHDRA